MTKDDRHAREIVANLRLVYPSIKWSSHDFIMMGIAKGRELEQEAITKVLIECGEASAAIWIQTNVTRSYAK